ncbi:MAG TPA: flagellar basal body protein [Caulobacteraceae bacterium]|nr:flagellar basal body protein [Caulobacteraceae bacterium]
MSPQDAQTRVEALIVLTERLTSAIAHQAQAFEAHRPQDAAGQMAEVAQLANVYRRESAEVRQNPGLVQAAAPALRARLTRATEAFDAVLARHGRAVTAAKTVTEGLVRAVAEEVATQRSMTSGYGAKGTSNAAPVTAFTLNRRA